MMSLGPRPILPGKFHEHASAFEAKFSQFFRAWEDVKSEVPSERLEFVRICRHSCKNAMQEFWESLVTYRESVVPAEADDGYKRLSHAFSKLGYYQDQLSATIVSIRNDKLEQLLLSGVASLTTAWERYFRESQKWQ
jgi:hypothetical protein